LLLAATVLVGAVRYDRQRHSDDYLSNARALILAMPRSERLWAHRVNSLGDLQEAKAIFAGVEADLVFDSASNSFRVRHPPKPDTGLSLDAYLASAADRPRLRLWLDWKNPTPGNISAAMAELNRLDAKYRIRGRTLVETPSEANFPRIASVSRDGFLHGLYLPTDRTLQALKAGPDATAGLGAELRRTLEQRGYGAITYDARLQPFVDVELDAFLNRRKLRRFSWDQRIDSSDPDTDPNGLSRKVKERRLTGLLISFPSRYRV
jgi:hypothetical protein